MINPVLTFLYIVIAAFHPLHVSVTEIEYDEKDKALEIMMRVFIDDLEMTMRKRYSQPELDILNPTTRTLDQMMQEYVKERLAISLDNKKQEVHYLGHEREGEAFIFYIEVAKVKKWSSIQVLNSVLTELYEDQSNLVHVTRHGKVRSLRLTRDNPSGNLSFE